MAWDVRCLQTPSGQRGIGVYTRRVLEHLARLGVQLHLVVWRGRPRPELDLAPCRWIELAPPLTRRLGWLQDRFWPRPWRRLLAEVDLVHFPSPFELDFGWPRGALACPRVVTVHDLIPVTHPGDCLRGKHRLLAPLYRRMAADLARADLLVAVSAYTGLRVQQLLGAAAPPVACVPLAADRRFSPGTSDAVGRLGLPAEFLLYVGGLNPNKNLNGLLAALAGLDIPLVVVGSWRPSWLQRARDQARRLAVAVCWLQDVCTEDLVSLYRAARGYIQPSLVEGFGLPVLEALACGTPVATSAAASLPEVAGPAALYFDARDVASIRQAVIRLWHDQDLRRRLAAAGPEQAARFSWEATARRTLQEYGKLLDSSSIRPSRLASLNG